MENWKEYKLGDVARLVRESWKVGDEELPYIALKHINEGQLSINSIGYSNEVGSNKYRFDSSTFLFGKLRPYFRKLYRPNFEGICSTDIWVIAPNGENDKDFLFYFFANQEFINVSYATSSGTRMPRANWNHMAKTVWDFPELPEQRAIAAVLSSLDDKIDLLHRQNQTLEEMAQTLFIQWFQPAPKLRQAGVEEADDDWEEGVLGDEFDFTMGQSPKGDTFNEVGEGVPMYQGNRDFGFRFPTNRVYTTDPKRFAQKYDTLISVRAPVGAQNMANEKCCIGRGVAAFRFKANSEFYSYTYFKMRSLMDEIKKFDDEGTVFGSIGKRDFENLELIIPPYNQVVAFQNRVKPIDDKIILNTEQIQTLTQLRDTLLPKLMSGEVRVNQPVRC